MAESWVDVKGYEGLYQVSDNGNVKRLPTKQLRERKHGTYLWNVPGGVLKPYKNHQGYYMCRLSKNGVEKDYSVHRLVAMNFIENPNNYSDVNHINEIKADNRVENLEWCTRAQNNEHGTRKERIYSHPNYIRRMKELGKERRKPVKAIHIKTGEVTSYDSTLHAEAETGASNQNISRVARGIRKSANGYRFEYV